MTVTIDVFRELENRIMEPATRRSRSALEELLAEDFVEIDSSGLVYTREEIIEALARQAPVERSATGFALRMLSGTLALVTHRAMKRDPESGKAIYSLRSSLWRRDGTRWQMIFHQGTLTAAPTQY